MIYGVAIYGVAIRQVGLYLLLGLLVNSTEMVLCHLRKGTVFLMTRKGLLGMSLEVCTMEIVLIQHLVGFKRQIRLNTFPKANLWVCTDAGWYPMAALVVLVWGQEQERMAERRAAPCPGEDGVKA